MWPARSAWGVGAKAIYMGLLAASSLLFGTPCQGAVPPPKQLRFQVRSVLWWSNGFTGGRTESTDYFDVAPGDDIDGPRAYPAWMPFAVGAPFRLGAIVDSEHAWVHFSGGIRPRVLAAGGGEGADGDSIIVSTVDRSFTSSSDDAGLEFNLRIEASSSRDAMDSSNGMQLSRHGAVVPGLVDCGRVQTSEAIGIFQILAMRSGRDSIPGGDRRIGTTEMEAVPRQLWKPGPLAVGKPITLIQEGSPSSDSSWTPMQGSTPIRRGEDVILFLLRDRDAPAKDRWTFSPFGGYGLLANHGQLVFSYPVRGVPIEKFRDDVMLCERMRFRPGRGVLMGRVLHAGSSAPIAGVAVRVEGSEATSQSNSEGWFQLFDLPIGQRMLFAKDSLGDVSAPVGVTDETVDSLELRVAQPGDPDTAPPAREGSAVNARAQRGTRFEGFRLPYDIPPMPYQRSDPGYPDDAKRTGFEGSLVVSARVDSLGHLMDAKVDVLDSLQRRGGAGRSPQIVEAAEACVRRWKFRPGLKNGRPVECQMGVVVHFAPPASDNPVPPGKRR